MRREGLRRGDGAVLCQVARLEVTAGRSLVLEEFADIKALGRMALREGGRTVAVGVVTRLIE